MARIARLLTVVLLTMAASAAVLATSATAHAEDGFKYWGYYRLTDGEWFASSKGADTVTPEDGTVEGWHYAVTTTKPDRPPRTDATFRDICAGETAAQGQKRVAVAIDYGTAAEADAGATPPQPEAMCAVVPAGANGQQVLESVAQVRVEDGLSCAINGYPPTGCGDPVTGVDIPGNESLVDFRMPSETQQQSAGGAEEGNSSWPLVGVGVLVLVLAAGGVVLARRRA
jgi:cobalamin biosynthesis Mg chelatase CobN